VLRLELLRRTDEQEERVVSQGRLERLIGGLVTVAECLQARPPQPVARRAGLTWEMLDEFERAEQAESRLLLLHHLSPVMNPGDLATSSIIRPALPAGLLLLCRPP